MDKMIDCYSPLTAEDVKALKANGYTTVGRYLGAKTHGWAKGMTPGEVAAIKSEGLAVVSIWEGNPTAASYFTTTQAEQDARDALIDATWLGQTAGSAIYFVVDYDAQPQDLAAIQTYFAAIHRTLGGVYKIGTYGGIRTLEALYTASSKPDYFWQAMAWSAGKTFAHAQIVQQTINARVDNMSVDLDNVLQEPGSWPCVVQPLLSAETVKKIQAQLNAVLGAHIAESGVYNAVTRGAVKSFQQLHRLKVTGDADAATQDALSAAYEVHLKAVQQEVQQTKDAKIQGVISYLEKAQNLIKSL